MPLQCQNNQCWVWISCWFCKIYKHSLQLVYIFRTFRSFQHAYLKSYIVIPFLQARLIQLWEVSIAMSSRWLLWWQAWGHGKMTRVRRDTVAYYSMFLLLLHSFSSFFNPAEGSEVSTLSGRGSGIWHFTWGAKKSSAGPRLAIYLNCINALYGMFTTPRAGGTNEALAIRSIELGLQEHHVWPMERRCNKTMCTYSKFWNWRLWIFHW